MEVDRIDIDDAGNVIRTPVTVDPDIRKIRPTIHPNPLVIALVLLLVGLLLVFLAGWYKLFMYCCGTWVMDSDPNCRISISLDLGSPVAYLYSYGELVAKFQMQKTSGSGDGEFECNCIFTTLGDGALDKFGRVRIVFSSRNQNELMFESGVFTARFVQIYT
jgi:hypothetical protein